MKNLRVLLIVIIVILLGGFFANNAYAANGDARSLAASLTRPFSDPKFTNPKYQYRVAGGATDVLYTVVKIYDDEDKMNDVKLYSKALYCLRGGVGFGAEDVSQDPVEYTEIGDMHIDAENIIENYMNKYKTGNESGKEINIEEHESYVGKECYGVGHFKLISDFYSSVIDNTEVPVTAESAQYALRILLSAYKSRGEEITV
jgi:hypothetical protein